MSYENKQNGTYPNYSIRREIVKILDLSPESDEILRKIKARTTDKYRLEIRKPIPANSGMPYGGTVETRIVAVTATIGYKMITRIEEADSTYRCEEKILDH